MKLIRVPDDSQSSESIPAPVERPAQSNPSDIPYVLPLGGAEHDRQMFQQHAFRVALGGNYAAPLTHPRRILDVGGGPGYWAYEMCEVFPYALVVNFDIDPTQRAVPPPPNYHFVQGSVLDPLPFADNTFDYVHQRLMLGAIPAKNWPSVIREFVRITNRGGWIELMEIIPGIEKIGPVSAQLHEWLGEAQHRRGFNMSTLLHLEAMLKSYGIINVVQRIIWLPLSKSSGRVGILLEHNMNRMFSSMVYFITRNTKISSEEYNRVRQEMIEEWRERGARYPVVIVYGQKPPLGVRHHTYP